ncbi:DISARM system SNF2-like helicase DrmD [Pseudanabaena sp. FACHB-2040]|uniref:DISARM system SNF2-like helicase DrmD n=1 Tax=Pseudanabaena sp. FACHB-2040 TaxID=2692859 RepID=UPI0016891B75|nr:DISARM system SNF2-like helicase DrmD [Pseudanabaena sp. FACHB-2040]MBD2261230.1 DEAD/DEAH box helicase [Pseudanabaena sp. FACHB-2040]
MTIASAVRGIPEQGQLVEVRGQRFVVTDLRVSTLPISPILSGGATTQHLVSLSSVEDEALGEELQVVWELEPGASIFEARALPCPDGFDSPDRLDAFLDAVRWGAASSADVRNIQSPFRSGIDIEDYQLDPVVRAIQMPRVNLLIADDVGLGKTIETGLVAQELILRQRVRRILVVCPSSLQVQWCDQMRDKFGLDFRIVNSELLRQLRRSRGLHVNPWTHFPRLITSIDFLKRDRPMRLMREVLPAEGEAVYPRKFDLLIVDEAHNVAPSGGGNYAIDSQRTAAIRLLAPHFEHKLFLTATPHNGYSESFTALLELLDSQRFARGIAPDPKQLQVVMIRRLKQELPPRWDGTPRFPVRRLDALTVDYTSEERQVNEALKHYTELRCSGAKDDKVELVATEFVLKLLKKRLFSSPAAFLTTLQQHEKTLKEGKSRSQRQLSKPSISVLRRQLEQIEEDFADDETYEESTHDAVSSSSQLFRSLTTEEQALLTSMQQWAEKASRRPDAKAQALLDWIEAHIRSDGKWTDQRVIIFTEYRTTQKWLYELLATKGLAQNERLMTLYGGMNSEDRERVKAAFQAGPDISNVRILLATDAASEGLDLQNYCSNLIHYEIPWNPNRMEQRNGRIDRHGQKASEVMIYHFVGKNYATQDALGARPGDLEGDLEFLMRAALKVNTIREDLGKVGPVIAAQVEEAMLGRRTTLDTRQAEQESEPIRRLLKFERKVRDQIERLKEQLQETRTNLRLTPGNIETVVRVGLEVARQPPLQPVKGHPGFYHLPPMGGSWSACGVGLAHPHTGEVRPLVFDPDLAHGRDDVVLIHLNHRLVQMCLRLLRAEVWSSSVNRSLHRVTARLVPSSTLESPAVVAYGRLVILGGDQQRLHEEVITAGGLLREGRFSRFKSLLVMRQALDSALPEPVPDGVRQHLAELWESYEEPLMQSLEARQSERSASLERSLQERCEKEVADITAIMNELKQSILAELTASEQPQQLSIFSDVEREQFDRNRNSLQARLDQIPYEIEQETALIRSRFANPTARLFPLAVTFLVPKRLIK